MTSKISQNAEKAIIFKKVFNRQFLNIIIISLKINYTNKKSSRIVYTTVLD